MKKWVAFILIVVLLLTGCSSGVSQEEYDALLAEVEALRAQLAAYEQKKNDDDITTSTDSASATTSVEEDLTQQLDIEILQWYQKYVNSEHYHYDLLVTNHSQQLVEATFSVKFFDAAGNVIGVTNVSTQALGPEETHYIHASNDDPFEYAELTVISVKPDDRYLGSMANVSCTDYAVNGKKVIFEVTNNGDAAVEFVKAYVVFYNGDEVVDVDYAYALDDDNELKPGATLSNEVTTNKVFTSYRIFYCGKIDRY